MSEFPAPLRGLLLRHARERRRAAWLVAGPDGMLVRSGGELALYGLDALAPGSAVNEGCPLLVGLLPRETPGGTADELYLPHVEVHGRRCDVWVLPTGDGETGVLFADVEEEVAAVATLQQTLHDVSLVVSRLGLCLLERQEAGRFRLIGEWPSWMSARLGERTRERVLDPADLSPFVENFLFDAEDYWSAGAPGAAPLRSGLWREEAFGDLWLEAVAQRSAGGRNFLVLQSAEHAGTERGRLLQRAREEQLESERFRDEVQKKEVLLHCIVHDLKAPLSAIVAGLSLLKKDVGPERTGAIVDLGLRQARKQSERIASLLEVFAAELQDLSAFEDHPARAPELRATVRDVTERLAPAFETAGVRLVVDAAPELPAALPVAARQSRLERLVENLLDNAKKKSPPGGTVRVTLTADTEEARVVVEDEGPGVDPALAPALFERFTTDGSGTGLGLYICRRHVESWGGSIEHEARAPHGARFRVTLRRALARA